MSKKLKIVLALAAGVVVLSLGSGAIVMAATGSSTPSTTTTIAATQCEGSFNNGLYATVATALGVTEQQLADAFQQATVQAQQQSISAALAQAVTKGTITQAESTAIQAWLAQRPASPTKDNMKAWEAAKPQLANPDAWKTILGFSGKGMMGPGADNTALLTQVAALLSTAAGKTITEAQLQAALTSAETEQTQKWQDRQPPTTGKPGNGPGFFGKGFSGMMPGWGHRGGSPQAGPTTTTTSPIVY
jgi:hypothetical protein